MRGLMVELLLLASLCGDATVAQHFKMECWTSHWVPARNARLKCCSIDLYAHTYAHMCIYTHVYIHSA